MLHNIKLNMLYRILSPNMFNKPVLVGDMLDVVTNQEFILRRVVGVNHIADLVLTFVTLPPLGNNNNNTVFL